MKIFASAIFALSFCALAAEKYGVYDPKGNRVSTFEAEPYELPEKTRQIKNNNPHKNIYVSSLKKGKTSTKPETSYQYHFKTGAYVEAGRNEIFSICPSKETDGTWISEYSVALNQGNCLSVQAPNLAGTFDILFMENSGHTDTIQVLVDQSYIEMGNYSHKIWTTNLMEYYDSDDITIRRVILVAMMMNGYYENRNYSQTIIVDKTKFTVGDAWYYYSVRDPRYDSNGKIIPFLYDSDLRLYPKNEKLEESRVPFVDWYGMNYWAVVTANERSEREGLTPAYIRNSKGEFVLDTSASGYRLPFGEEWFFLMRAGATTRYYWGEEEDSLTVSRYAWVRPAELKPVAQLLPNGFGLYDMMGIAFEIWENYEFGYISPEYKFMGNIGTSCNWGYNKSFRLLRKTPKLHKLEKF